MRFARDDALIDPFQHWKDVHNLRRDQLAWLRFLLISSVVAWTAWALRKIKLLWIGMALSLPLYAFVLNLPGYYLSIFLISAVLARARPQLSVVLLFASAATAIMPRTF